MPRTPEKQKRLGKLERKQVDLLTKKISRYRIFSYMRNQRETRFNERLLDHLRQEPNPLVVSSKDIPVVLFADEEFRPEFYLKMGLRKTICALECKRLTKHNAKSRLKEGLSQALLYSTIYKYVIFLFLDFTKDSIYASRFGPGNKPESRFAKQLRHDSNIRIIVLKPVD
jgi:hypothetical protein